MPWNSNQTFLNSVLVLEMRAGCAVMIPPIFKYYPLYFLKLHALIIRIMRVVVKKFYKIREFFFGIALYDRADVLELSRY
jgi:hypothetical protein